MAEIPIQEKRGSKSWLWILALVALALLAWSLLSNDDADDVNGAPAAETGVVTPTAATTTAHRAA
jgi:hypothetical protein